MTMEQAMTQERTENKVGTVTVEGNRHIGLKVAFESKSDGSIRQETFVKGGPIDPKKTQEALELGKNLPGFDKIKFTPSNETREKLSLTFDDVTMIQTEDACVLYNTGKFPIVADGKNTEEALELFCSAAIDQLLDDPEI